MKQFVAIMLVVMLLVPLLSVTASAYYYFPERATHIENLVNSMISMPQFSEYPYYAAFATSISTSNFGHVRFIFSSEPIIKVGANVRESHSSNLTSYRDYTVVSFSYYRASGFICTTQAYGHYLPEYSTATIEVFEDGYEAFLEDFVYVKELPQPPVDTSELETLLAKARAIQDEGYRASTWNNLQTAISSSQLLLDSGDYTQETIDAQVKYLQAAINGLELLPVTPDLASLVTHALTIQDVGYTMYSWGIFQGALSNAQSLLAGRDYTQSSLTSSYNRLESAIDGLTFDIPDPGGDGDRFLLDGIRVSDLLPYKEAVMQNMDFSVRNGFIVFGILASILFSIKLLSHFLNKSGM